MGATVVITHDDHSAIDPFHAFDRDQGAIVNVWDKSLALHAGLMFQRWGWVIEKGLEILNCSQARS